MVEYKGQFDAEIKRMFNQYPAVPGISCAWVNNGEVQGAVSIGVIDKCKRVPVVSSSLFQAGSISKSITAWAVLRLVQEQAINLDDTIDRYLPDIKFTCKAEKQIVTIRQLLSHTGGLSRIYYTGSTRPIFNSLWSATDGGSSKSIRLETSAGNQFAYTGLGYLVLQLLIERISTMSFCGYMHKYILPSLGMNASTFELIPELEDSYCSNYGYWGLKVPTLYYPQQASAGLYTTGEDLARFVCANLASSNDLLTRENVRQLHTRIERTIPYGLGFRIATIGQGERIVWHKGHNRGAHAIFMFLPKRKKGLAILTNSERGHNLINCLVAEWLNRNVAPLSNKNLNQLGLNNASIILRMSSDLLKVAGAKLNQLCKRAL